MGRSVREYVDASAVELTLAPAAAHAAHVWLGAPGASGPVRATAIGIASLDRAAASLGATFSAEFAGERMPAPGSRTTDFTRYVIVHLPDGVSYDDALARFAACPGVERVSPLAVLPLSIVPDDSLYSEEWWLPDIQAPGAWGGVLGDNDDVVAVIDTGLLPYHPDLLFNQWINDAEKNGLPGVDDDGNGFVDDVTGWDFVDLASASLAATGEDWRDADNDPNDMVGHGTACAGLIGADTNNRIGMAGTIWYSKIMPLRIGWAFPGALRGEGEVRMDFAAEAIRYATRMGARILNMSFSNLDTDGLGAAVTDAVAAGVIPIVAAGNNGEPNDLGLRDDVISVAATDPSRALEYFSNLGPWTTLAAPGGSMKSLWSIGIGADSLGLRTPGYSPVINGTSFAAPLVAGAAALVESRRRQEGHAMLDAQEMKLRLVETTQQEIAPGLGLLSIAGAVTPSHPSSVARLSGATVGASVVIPLQLGGAQIVCVTTDSSMVMLDGTNLDTLWVRRLADQPVTGVAGAVMNAGYGIGLFCGTAGGTIEGFDVHGTRLPGFPTEALGVGLSGGPALGDLDGDGKLEIVCGADDGTIMAWHADGSAVAGWPRVAGSGRVLPVALTDLDGVAGVEVIATCDDGHATVLHGNGTRLSGWPKLYPNSLRAPVVTYFLATNDTGIVFTEYDLLHALNAAGVERNGFPVALGGPAVSDLAVGDLNDDLSPDVVVALDLPPRVAAYDGNGAALGGSWPHGMKSGLVGTPVIGPLAVANANAVLVQRAGDLIALGTAGDSLGWFPKPGMAGAAPTIADVNGDRWPDVVAGTGADPLHHFYVYSSGMNGVVNVVAPWPTPRANTARTGSLLYRPPIFVPDLTPPGRVTDLRIAAVGDTSVLLVFTASGDDSTSGRPKLYEVHADTYPVKESDFNASPWSRSFTPTVNGGQPESLQYGGFTPGARLHFGLRAVDQVGNVSLVSNDVAAELHVGGPLDGAQELALAPTTNPAIPPFSFYWHADPAAVGTPQRLRLYDVTGRVRLDHDLGTGAGGVWVWDGRDDHGNAVRSGVYFARLQSGARSKTTRIALLR